MALLNREIQWRKLSAESIAVVLSILLAFAIDAWWEERQKNEQVLSLLQEVLEDLKSGKEYVEYNRAMGLARKEASLSLLENVVDGGKSLSDEEGYRLASHVGWFIDTDIMPMGSLNELLSGGHISQIESAKLRRLILNLPGQIENARLNLRPEFDFLYNEWFPYLARRSNHIQMATHGISHVPGHPNEEWPRDGVPIGEPVPIVDLLGDREFRNLVFANVSNLNNSGFYLDLLDNYFDEIIELIVTEIGLSD